MNPTRASRPLTGLAAALLWLAPLAASAGEINGSVEFFSQLSKLEAFCPDLPVEDFENSSAPPMGVDFCPGPLESSTGGGGCYAPGELLEGFRLDSSNQNGILLVGANFAANPSTMAGPAQFGDDTVIDFPGGVTGVGFELLDPSGPSTLMIDVYGSDGLLGTTVVPGLPSTLTFVGIRSLDPDERIFQVQILCGGVPEEIFDHLRFGFCDPCAEAAPTSGCRVNGSPPGLCRGTSASDVIIGTAGKDVIDGRGGDDYLVGRQGADLLCGRGGADVLVGNGGGDTLVGGRGPDILEGLGGGDTLLGQRGNDHLAGGSGNDNLDGGPGNDDATEGGLGSDACQRGEIVTGCE